MFKCSLGSTFFISKDAPGHRLVDMYVKLTEEKVKAIILSQMTSSSSTLRVLICSVAFGMGVDVVGVQNVLHNSCPCSLAGGVCPRDGPCG